MKKHIIPSILVAAFSFWANAEDVFVSKTGTDFSALEEGPANVWQLSDEGTTSGGFFWSAVEPDAIVTAVRKEGSAQVLDVNVPTGARLVRSVLPREAVEASAESLLLYGEGRDRLYYEVAFSNRNQLCIAVDGKLSLRVTGDDEPNELRVTGNDEPNALYVTAGQITGDWTSLADHEYRLQMPADWKGDAACRLAITLVKDITVGAPHVAGFTVHLFQGGVWQALSLEGNQPEPVSGALATGDQLTAEARVLLSERRLLPSRAKPGSNEAMAAVGLAFTGEGVLNSVYFHPTADELPGLAPESFFTLAWGGGFKRVAYAVDGGSTTDVGSVASRREDIRLASGAEALSLTLEYDEKLGYVGLGSGMPQDCTFDKATQTFDLSGAQTRHPSGRITARRDDDKCLLVGGTNGYATVAEAVAAGLAADSKRTLLVLSDDFTITNNPTARAKGLPDDGGFLDVTQGLFGGQRFTLDLSGHTLRGTRAQAATIRMNGGELTITDSIGGGRVMPSGDYEKATDPVQRAAIENLRGAAGSSPENPSLVISGGHIGGAITTNDTRYAQCPATMGISDAPTFVADDAVVFPYDGYLMDKTAYFAYDAVSKRWKQAGTGAFVWCGKGADTSWHTSGNWKGGAAPGADDRAVVPAAAGRWSIDWGEGIQTTNILLVGDVELHGTNDCTRLVWAAGSSGRLSGDAALVYSGGESAPSLADRLADDWAGEVRLVGVGAASPKSLRNIESWGKAGSTVVFNGVCGYISHTTRSFALPWRLVLEDFEDGQTTAPAWRNDAGYSGSTVTFARLAGSGAFLSPSNAVPNRQVLRFADVSDYTGTLEVRGKRVLLGGATKALSAQAGSITWSTNVAVRVGATPHACLYAAFAGPFALLNGKLDDFLATYDRDAAGADRATVTLADGTSASLDTSDHTVTVVPLTARSIVQAASSGSRLKLKAAALSVSGNEVTLGGETVTFADYYDVSAVRTGDGGAEIALALNARAVPVIGSDGAGSAALEVRDGRVAVTVVNAREGLFYALQRQETLGGAWRVAPVDDGAGGTAYARTVFADGTSLRLETAAAGGSAFFRVLVSDIDGFDSEALE